MPPKYNRKNASDEAIMFSDSDDDHSPPKKPAVSLLGKRKRLLSLAKHKTTTETTATTVLDESVFDLGGGRSVTEIRTSEVHIAECQPPPLVDLPPILDPIFEEKTCDPSSNRVIYDLDSDDDDDDKIVEEKPPRREETRSPSLTPPPALPEEKQRALREAREQYDILKKTLNTTFFPEEFRASPTDSQFDTPPIEALSSSASASASPAPTITAPKPVEIVTLKIQFVPYPDREHSRKSMSVKLKSTHPFEKFIHVVCQKWGVTNPRDMIFVHNNVPLFPRGTPGALRMSSTSKQYIDAYQRPEYETLQADQARALEAAAAAEENPPSPSPEPTTDNVEFLLLKLQDKTGIQKFRVRKNATVSALISAYRTKTTSTDKTLSVCLDGETLGEEMTLEEAELESGDMLEVHCK